ncbi:hypothetical protein JCM39194_24370 [Desulfotomaculum varum]
MVSQLITMVGKVLEGKAELRTEMAGMKAEIANIKAEMANITGQNKQLFQTSPPV